jgi:class 3 adenylate cyclase
VAVAFVAQPAGFASARVCLSSRRQARLNKGFCSASALLRTCVWLARPVHDLSITPLVPANAHANDGYAQPSYLAGQERTIAVLFADLRTFTRIAEQKLPYDLVFLLNSYFEAAGKSITGAGGVVDKFGDGVMALFGSKANSNNSRSPRELYLFKY